LLSPDFSAALAFANDLHHGHVRKGTEIPFVSHLMAVAAIVLEHGGSEDEAIAALLHDAVEDRGGAPVLKRIRRRFGDTVADIVQGCSDSEEFPKPPWKERKLRYIEHVRTASPSVRLVSAADKLHNARCILADYRVLGDDLWQRFNAGKEDALWYYRSLVQAFGEAGGGPLIEELDRVVTEFERVCA
jgi:(p)ppGpp synthase/HD superfamily hydrolase